jgi:hypothetical protein
MSAISSGSRSFVTSATSDASIKERIISLTSSERLLKISPSRFSSINCQIMALLFGELDSNRIAISYGGIPLNIFLRLVNSPLESSSCIKFIFKEEAFVIFF